MMHLIFNTNTGSQNGSLLLNTFISTLISFLIIWEYFTVLIHSIVYEVDVLIVALLKILIQKNVYKKLTEN